MNIFGFRLGVSINVQTVVTLLVAALTATGADWLLQDHPAIGKSNRLEHWLLPALTSWIISFPLFQLPLSPLWWAGFALGGGLLMLVLLAEYIVVDPDDVRQPPAAAGLTVVSFALYLALAVALRFSGMRLFLVLPALMLSGWLVSLRSMHLQLHGTWAFLPAAAIAVLLGQFAAALHYLPISPIAYGLVLLGPAYALTVLMVSLAEGQTLRQGLVEPVVVLLIVWGVALWIR